jgi:hypothetical protein
LPPVSRWIVHGGHEEAHVEQARPLASSFSASLSGRPKFCCSNVFLNSGPTGPAVSSPPCRARSGTRGRAQRPRQQVERLGKLFLETRRRRRGVQQVQDRQRAR